MATLSKKLKAFYRLWFNPFNHRFKTTLKSLSNNQINPPRERLIKS